MGAALESPRETAIEHGVRVRWPRILPPMLEDLRRGLEGSHPGERMKTLPPAAVLARRSRGALPGP
jgi:hypothetical protein